MGKVQDTRVNIDRHVPVPPPRIQRWTVDTYPWGEMEVGDSFTIPKHLQARYASHGRAWCKRFKPTWRVVTRTVGEDVVRVWLVHEDDFA